MRGENRVGRVTSRQSSIIVHLSALFAQSPVIDFWPPGAFHGQMEFASVSLAFPLVIRMTMFLKLAGQTLAAGLVASVLVPLAGMTADQPAGNALAQAAKKPADQQPAVKTPVDKKPADKKPAEKKPAKPKKVENKPAAPPSNQNKATPFDRIKARDGFKVELLYSVPGDQQGSWVNLCLDNKGRIIASDQFGGLYRFAAPPAGQPLDPANIEKVPADIRAANGLLWAFNALYVGVNDYQDGSKTGVYRVTDSDGDDKLDKVEKLKSFQAGGDHGVHAVLPHPDGKSLTLITGNATKLTDAQTSRVPRIWGEDHLLPRMPDGRGFMRSTLGPGGAIYRFSPDGKEWEIESVGYRNIFDAAYNHDGELFTYDADMEYDFNTSWYRPTRVCHAVSGSDWGWRNGAGKRPEFYADTWPATVNIGPGSPTGVTFGYGAKFPAKYQEALYILDWSWGKIYAVHLEPEGSSYKAVREEFLYGVPLPVTDAIIAGDGAMYFAIGGRKVQSGFYRVTYTGQESTAAVERKPQTSLARDLRHSLEAFHGHADPQALDAAWPHLNHPDRFIRNAARTALEFQPVETWAERALRESDSGKKITALLAASRAGGVDPAHRQPGDIPANAELGQKIIAALAALPWDALSHEQRLALVRTYEIAFVRFGQPAEELRGKVLAQLDSKFPADNFEANWLLCETLVSLESPTVARKAIALLDQAPTQEEQIEYARSLRMLKTGWTPALRNAYFEWFQKAGNYSGGASFEQFIKFIRDDATANLSDAEKQQIGELLTRQPEKKSPLEVLAGALQGRTQTHEWNLDELAGPVTTQLKGRDFENGQKMFAATGCFACHRFNNTGGMTGPDLTTAGRRYSGRDLLDNIIHPSKEINEQFIPVNVVTVDGRIVTGVIVNLNGDRVMINTDLSKPNQQEAIDRNNIEIMEPSKVSSMPVGLLNRLTQEEILDLAAFVLSSGDRSNPMFQQK